MSSERPRDAREARSWSGLVNKEGDIASSASAHASRVLRSKSVMSGECESEVERVDV